MRQITVDFPLETMPPGLIPEKLLGMTSSIKFLRLDINGFLFTFKVQKTMLVEVIRFLRKHYKYSQKGVVKVSHEGQGIILVSGAWSHNGRYLWNDDKGYLSHEKEFSSLMSMYQSQTFFLKSPEITENSLRFVLVGDNESIRAFEETLGNVRVPYHVKCISGFQESADSAFDRLTPQQRRILRLAYVEGYYTIPRKISTEKLAKLLKMEKGNVGEHIRRAEKNVMDFLMTT
jgi:hypothetical protein